MDKQKRKGIMLFLFCVPGADFDARPGDRMYKN